MSYKYFMAGTQLPVPPSKFTISIPSKNETVTLVNDGDINILKKAGLKEFSFDIYLPQVKYPFATYENESDIIPPLQYLILLQTLKEDKLPFALVINRRLPRTGATWNTSEIVSLEDYEVKEDTENGFDVVVSVKLKQYKHHQTQRVVLSDNGLTYTTVRDTTKKVNAVVMAKEGDTLPSLIKREYGECTPELIIKVGTLNRATLQAHQLTRGGFMTDLTPGMLIRLTNEV